jgi:hypothetical protein
MRNFLSLVIFTSLGACAGVWLVVQGEDAKVAAAAQPAIAASAPLVPEPGSGHEVPRSDLPTTSVPRSSRDSYDYDPIPSQSYVEPSSFNSSHLGH